MSTSGETVFSMTAHDVVTAALVENRILASGREPKPAELADCVLRLNAMLKSWDARGSAMWRESEEQATFGVGVASVSLPEGVSDVAGARVVVSATYERPLAQWERSDYYSLPNRAQAGSPTAFYVSAGPSPLLYVWPVPTVSTVIKLDAIRKTETITEPSQTIDIPEMWLETVYSNLAVRVAGMFGAQLGEELVIRARALETQLLDHDRPDSYRLEPDSSYY